MKITKELLHKTAHLARLEIAPEKEEILMQKLESVLTWIEKLNEINTSTIEPLIHMSEEVNVWREDVSAFGLTSEQALSNAPEKKDSYFTVPKVL